MTYDEANKLVRAALGARDDETILVAAQRVRRECTPRLEVARAILASASGLEGLLHASRVAREMAALSTPERRA